MGTNITKNVDTFLMFDYSKSVKIKKHYRINCFQKI